MCIECAEGCHIAALKQQVLLVGTGSSDSCLGT